MNFKLLIFFGTYLFLAPANVSGQELDTFRIKLDKITSDTAKVNSIVAYARTILYSDPPKAMEYCNEAITTAQKASFGYGLANAYRLAGAYNNDIKGDFKEAERYFNLSMDIYSQTKDYRNWEGVGAIYHGFGAMHQRTGNYLKAIENYVEASRILDSIGNKNILPKTYNNLSSLYSFLQLFDKAEYYARAGLKQAKLIDDKQVISVTGVTLSDALMQQGKYDEVLSVLKISDSIAKQRNDRYILTLSSYNYSTYYAYYRKDYKTSLRYALKAYEHSQILDNPFELARTSTNLAEHFLFNNEIQSAINYAGEALEYSEAVESTDLTQRMHYTLGIAYRKKGDFKTAAGYLQSAAQLKDSVILEVNRLQINFLEALYQKEKNEKNISRLENEKIIQLLLLKKRNSIIGGLVISVMLLGLLAWIYIRNIRHKKALTEKELELQKQKVTEIEKQRQLDATLSVLQGEEAERSRLARDLHDGLGGLLSGVKLSLTKMRGNFILVPDTIEQFNSALGLLDTSIRELRRVAHNMMPEALVKFGLRDALSDFCNSIDNSKKVILKFQSFGTEKRIDSNIEINVYRIAQELINNAIKHSAATEMLVQLVQEENRVHLTVQDNGKGFNTEILKTSKGSGFSNIQSRLESLNGVLNVYSKTDEGTEISVEFTLFPSHESQ
jgi:signal transduction histidine kinase